MATDPGRERARSRVAGVACLHVDVVIRACDEHVRVISVHRDRRLVLLILRERAPGVADADANATHRCKRGDHAGCDKRDRGRNAQM